MALLLRCQHVCASGARSTSRRPRTQPSRPPTPLLTRPAPLTFAPFTSARHTASRAQRLRTNSTTFEEAAVVPVYEKGELSQFPDSPSVYAVYDDKDEVQYIGVSRRLGVTVAGHLRDQADFTSKIKYALVADGTREALTEAWKGWIEAAVAVNNKVPPGNAPGDSVWKRKSKPAKPEILLTAGKGITGITIEGLIDNVVKDVKVVAFIKGKRLQPQCGFSYKMLNILTESGIDYEVVDVLDEFHNPGLREAIKTYSQWPTIPQLYVNGEFVGGADIVEQLQQSGELNQILSAEKAS